MQRAPRSPPRRGIPGPQPGHHDGRGPPADGLRQHDDQPVFPVDGLTPGHQNHELRLAPSRYCGWGWSVGWQAAYMGKSSLPLRPPLTSSGDRGGSPAWGDLPICALLDQEWKVHPLPSDAGLGDGTKCPCPALQPVKHSWLLSSEVCLKLGPRCGGSCPPQLDMSRSC